LCSGAFARSARGPLCPGLQPCASTCMTVLDRSSVHGASCTLASVRERYVDAALKVVTTSVGGSTTEATPLKSRAEEGAEEILGTTAPTASHTTKSTETSTSEGIRPHLFECIRIETSLLRGRSIFVIGRTLLVIFESLERQHEYCIRIHLVNLHHMHPECPGTFLERPCLGLYRDGICELTIAEEGEM
jgi:hypothetical protein